MDHEHHYYHDVILIISIIDQVIIFIMLLITLQRGDHPDQHVHDQYCRIITIMKIIDVFIIIIIMIIIIINMILNLTGALHRTNRARCFTWAVGKANKNFWMPALQTTPSNVGVSTSTMNRRRRTS